MKNCKWNKAFPLACILLLGLGSGFASADPWSTHTADSAVPDNLADEIERAELPLTGDSRQDDPVGTYDGDGGGSRYIPGTGPGSDCWFFDDPDSCN